MAAAAILKTLKIAIKICNVLTDREEIGMVMQFNIHDASRC